MAITLRNQRVEAMIREIGRHTGEGPSAVIARAVEALKSGHVALSKDEKRARFDRLMETVPPRDPNLTWGDLEADMNSIF